MEEQLSKAFKNTGRAFAISIVVAILAIDFGPTEDGSGGNILYLRKVAERVLKLIGVEDGDGINPVVHWEFEARRRVRRVIHRNAITGDESVCSRGDRYYLARARNRRNGFRYVVGFDNVLENGLSEFIGIDHVAIVVGPLVAVDDAVGVRVGIGRIGRYSIVRIRQMFGSKLSFPNPARSWFTWYSNR